MNYTFAYRAAHIVISVDVAAAKLNFTTETVILARIKVRPFRCTRNYFFTFRVQNRQTVRKIIGKKIEERNHTG